MATSTASTTTPFKSSLQLQTVTPQLRNSIDSSLPDAGSFNANEARYWAEKFGLGHALQSRPTPQFAHHRQVTLNAGSAAMVHQLVFGPASVKQKCVPLATVCGPRVQLYGTSPQSTIHRVLAQHQTTLTTEGGGTTTTKTPAVVEHDRQIPTGGLLATAAAFRNDARLLAVATDGGQIRVADTTSRATLCTWQTTSRLPVRAVDWFRDGQHLMAAGDDGLLTIWHLKSGGSIPIITCSGHGDAVRCAALWQLPLRVQHSWPVSSMVATGSYDHTVRLWNMDDLDKKVEDRCLAVLAHGSPVEAVLWMRSKDPAVPMWLISAGGTDVKVWNPLSGRCVSSIKTLHRKTITCLLSMPRKDFADDGSGVSLHSRILTGSLDGFLRVHAWDDLHGKLLHLVGIHLPDDLAITSLAVTASADRIAIGTTSGKVLVRQRGPSKTSHKRTAPPRAGTYAYFTRGMNVDSVADDDYVVTPAGKKRKFRTFDLALKQFRYGDALDEALQSRNPQVVVAVLEELGKRRGLTIALSNRDEDSLEPLLAFMVRYITRSRCASLLIGVTEKLIDIYGNIAGQSELIDELFAKLRNQVDAECKAQRLLLRVVGQLDAIMAATELEEQENTHL